MQALVLVRVAQEPLFRTGVHHRVSCTRLDVGLATLDTCLLLPTCYLGESPAASAGKRLGCAGLG